MLDHQIEPICPDNYLSKLNLYKGYQAVCYPDDQHLSAVSTTTMLSCLTLYSTIGDFIQSCVTVGGEVSRSSITTVYSSMEETATCCFQCTCVPFTGILCIYKLTIVHKLTYFYGHFQHAWFFKSTLSLCYMYAFIPKGIKNYSHEIKL